MKLRNKKTGKIINSKELLTDEFVIDVFSKDFNYFISKINKIQEEWEDCEEPKEYWYIDTTEGSVVEHTQECFELTDKERKEIGNYFETKEEAERAVEKLKAWKRLKDNGFEFDGIRLEGSNCLIKTKLKDNTGVTFNNAQQFYEDVDLLFGGEE